MGIKIIDGERTTSMVGWELLRRSEISHGMICMQHGTNPPLQQLLKDGDLYMVCKYCITEYCKIGDTKRATGERSASELDLEEEGH